MLSFLAGALIGGSIALLTAPQSGERTRRQLKRIVVNAKEKAEDYYDDVTNAAAKATEKVQDNYHKAKRTVKSTVNTARKA